MTADELQAGFRLAALDSAVSEGASQRLARTAFAKRFARGEVLWRAATPSRGLYIVVSGSIRVLRSRRGRQHLVHLSSPGATMGEVALFARGIYPGTAVGSEDGCCLVVPPDALLEEVARNAPLATALLQRVARRVDHLVQRLEAQTLAPVRARIAASLVGLIAQDPKDVANVRSSQAEWAEDLGTVREVLARELGRMKREGLIEAAGPGRLRVLDVARLERMALGEAAG